MTILRPKVLSMSDYTKFSDRLDWRIFDFCETYIPHFVWGGLFLFFTVVTVLISPAPTSTMEWAGMLLASFVLTLIAVLPVIFVAGLIFNFTFTIYWAISDAIDEVRYRQGS